MPVHEIHMLLFAVQSLAAFHAVSVSQFSGHSKKTDWQVFLNFGKGLGKGPSTEDILRSPGAFICKIYGVLEVHSCYKARVKLFCIGHTARDSITNL